MLMKATIFFGLYAAFATANVCCDHSGTNPKGTKNWSHVACKMYVGNLMLLTYSARGTTVLLWRNT